MRYIHELKSGDMVSDIYLCKSKQTLKTKAGKSYYSMMLQDKTGTVDAKVWELTPGIEYFETSACRTNSFPFTVRILGRSVEIRLFRRRTDPVGTNSAYPSIFTPAMPYCVYEKLSGREKIPGDSRGAPHIGEYGEITYLKSLS